jgi:hypothetical protein
VGVAIAGVAAIVSAELLVVGCGDRRDRGNPIAPSVAPGRPIQSSAVIAGSGSRGSARGASISLPGEGAVDGARMVAFPPRNDSFEFRQELERKYRDGLRRTATTTFVDVEGDVVWTQEYLRYRTNGCAHAAAVQRVLPQIDGGPGAPVCADVASRLVAFPPRDDSFAFRQELERKYRDGLGRGTTSTFVDVEGAVVWTQEYLRYRVNACSHAVSVARVFEQIDGGRIGPVCVSVPERDPFTGVWHGTSDYPNAPFTMDLELRGRVVSGWYQDQKDRGSVDADDHGGGDVRFHVYFGDTGFFMDGRFDGPDRIRGSFLVPVLGNRRFTFDMRR